MQIKQSFLLLVHTSSTADLIVFTPRLSLKFTTDASARNLGVTFDELFVLNSIFPKHTVVAFMTFVTFAVFVGVCLFLSLKLLQLLL